MTDPTVATNEFLLPPSKRAARRILQRAFVLTGRDKQFRQHIREARVTTLWVLEDWDLVWSVMLDRGKIEFERRPAKRPDLTFRWPTAQEFFLLPGARRLPESSSPGAVDPVLRRLASLFLQCFLGHLGHVLRHPVDGAGESLL
jgi:hypothetical protein